MTTRAVNALHPLATANCVLTRVGDAETPVGQPVRPLDGRHPVDVDPDDAGEPRVSRDLVDRLFEIVAASHVLQARTPTAARRRLCRS